jgi:hypothetical protein
MEERKEVRMGREEAALYYRDGYLGFSRDFDRECKAARTLRGKDKFALLHAATGSTIERWSTEGKERRIFLALLLIMIIKIKK